MSKECCEADSVDLKKEENKTLKKVFWAVLFINFSMFLVELISGIISHSNALTADSLDMLGDTFVYAVSLFVLSKTDLAKANASLVKGIVMTLLGVFVIGQAVFKILNPALPIAETISLIGFIALVANLACFLLLMKYKNTDLNVRSAWICSRNDVIANGSVIGAGVLVGYFNSMWPDIIVGLGISLFVLNSSIGIMKAAVKGRQVKVI